MALLDRGLDLARLDSTSPEEVAAFRDAYKASKGYSLPAFEFWLDHRPDLVKRHRLQCRTTPTDAALERPAANVLAFLHYYAVVGYEAGILYETRLAQHNGTSKEGVLDALAVAFIHAGPRGMNFVASALDGYDWEGGPGLEQQADAFPAGWEVDPEAFRCGLDFSDPHLRPGEADLVRDWYLSTSGEVPRHVEFLATYKPDVLKAYRSRFENAITVGLPKQMMPYFLLHLNVIRGWSDGMREAALMARGFGMSAEEVVDVITWAMFYGGPDALSLADAAVGPLLRSWDQGS